MPPLFNPPESVIYMYGPGTLGDVVIVGTPTLALESFYRSLSVPVATVLNTNAFRASVRNTCNIAGTITANGTTATGSAGGTATAPAAIVGAAFDGYLTLLGVSASRSGLIPLVGAGGGGSGSGDGVITGRAGGGGGGVLILNARLLTITGTAQANGGAGANAAAGNTGGGGGGGGGAIFLFYDAINDNTATYQTNAGTFGTGFGTGTNGVAGSNGAAKYTPFRTKKAA
jgi:hypothetical protein